ncbi:uncharacterized protein [Amphiura filiformis]|uniref:uncharacterized protein isoform X1 n=1 Tax=Amphiura filiformis TaxID=82378 RepID=UPI003B21F8A8
MNKLIIIAILTVFVTHAMLTAEASDCEVQGVVYSNGDPIPSDNPCEFNCVCQAGQKMCAVMSCQPAPDMNCVSIPIDGECCPSTYNCPDLCPSGEPWHRCSGDLCEGKTCHVPGATCVPDQCGGCDSYFVRQNGTKIKKCNKNRK